MSLKNQLQEIFQKKNLALPEYSTYSVGSQFQSSVYLPDGRTFTGELRPRKKDAEQSASEKALEILNQKVKLNLDRDIYIYIDKENFNQNTVKELIESIDSSRLHVREFMSKNSTGYIYTNSDSSICHDVIQIDSYKKDAVDFGIAMHLTDFIIRKESRGETIEEIIIVSSDHFVDTLMDCINTGLTIGKPPLTKCRTFNELYNYLTQ